MNILIDNESTTTTDLKPLLRIAEAIMAEVRSDLVEITLVDEEQMSIAHQNHLGVKKATDVLSFPIDGLGKDVYPHVLGLVLICPTCSDSLEKVLIHGLLHLLGFDDLERQEEMEKEERRWAKLLKIS